MKTLISSTLLSISLLIVNTLNAQVFENPEVTKLAEGFQFTEGPVWMNDMLLFSDIPANTVYSWTAAEGSNAYINPSENSNGLGLDQEGNLILCQHGARQVSRLNEDKSFAPLATQYNGKRLNSPNDLTFHSDGSIFFTDPPYGLSNPNDSETGFSGIYRLTSSGDLQLLDSTLAYPNGIGFSPDESKLYVTESQELKIYVWDVVDDTTITNKQEFASQQGSSGVGGTDGMKVDAEGYIYSTGPAGVYIYSPDGTLVNTIPVPGQTTNCAWGPNGEVLYITSGNAIYKIAEAEITSLNKMNDENDLITAQPNPFNHVLTIPIYLKNDEELSIAIFNSEGKRVKQLASADYFSAGHHTISWNASGAESGIYFVNLAVADGIQQTIRMVKL